MEKKIIILSGKADPKNAFAKYVRFDLGVYVRHRNAYDDLEKAARLLGCTASKKEKKYYDEILGLLSWANETWNFKYNYAVKEIQSFLAHPKAQLLALHGYENEAQMLELLNAQFGVKTVLVTDETPILSNDKKYDYVLVYGQPEFENDVKKMLGIE